MMTGEEHVVDLFSAKAKKKLQAAQVFHIASQWMQSHKDSVESLLGAIELAGTPVLVVEGLAGMGFQLALKSHGFDVGFIAPPSSHESTESYRALQALVQQFGYPMASHQHFKHGVFVLTPRLLTPHYLAHQLHHWISFQQGLPGYTLSERRAYKVFKTKYNGVWGPQLDKESPEFIKLLRHPMRRDIETLEFVKHITDEILAPLHESRHHLNNGTALA